MTIEDQSSFSIMIINHRFNHRAISIRLHRFWIGVIYRSTGGLIPPGWDGIRPEGGTNRCKLILGRIGSEFELHCWMHSDGIRFEPDRIGLIRCASSMLTGSDLWIHSDRCGGEFETNWFPDSNCIVECYWFVECFRIGNRIGFGSNLNSVYENQSNQFRMVQRFQEPRETMKNRRAQRDVFTVSIKKNILIVSSLLVITDKLLLDNPWNDS